MIAGLAISDMLMRAGPLASIVSLRSDVITVAQSAIVSGFGLAIVGVLRSGFAAFSRFFDAVLQRSSAPRTPVQTVERPDVPVASPPSDPSETAPEVTVVARAVPPRPVRPTSPAPPLQTEKRNYVILADGSVEVETMFGTRVFATLDEARDFIR